MKPHFSLILLLLLPLIGWSQSPPTGPISVYFFLSENCPICRYYTPELQQLHQDYAEQGITFTGVFPMLSSDEESVNTFGESFGLPFDLVKDHGQRMTQQLHATITPEVVVVDTNGEILYRGRIDNAYERPGQRRRVVTTSELRDALDAILAGLPVANPISQPIGCFITK